MKEGDSKPVQIIFDTDMDIDCDDAGALAVLHALMDYEEAEILGVVVDVPLEASAKCRQSLELLKPNEAASASHAVLAAASPE